MFRLAHAMEGLCLDLHVSGTEKRTSVGQRVAQEHSREACRSVAGASQRHSEALLDGTDASECGTSIYRRERGSRHTQEGAYYGSGLGSVRLCPCRALLALTTLVHIAYYCHLLS